MFISPSYFIIFFKTYYILNKEREGEMQRNRERRDFFTRLFHSHIASHSSGVEAEAGARNSIPVFHTCGESPSSATFPGVSESWIREPGEQRTRSPTSTLIRGCYHQRLQLGHLPHDFSISSTILKTNEKVPQEWWSKALKKQKATPS